MKAELVCKVRDGNSCAVSIDNKGRITLTFTRDLPHIAHEDFHDEDGNVSDEVIGEITSDMMWDAFQNELVLS